MKHIYLAVLIVSLLFSGCRKEKTQILDEACIEQTDNPAGRSYSPDSIITVTYAQKNCGVMPLSRNNYWVYEDSFFTDGVFTGVKMDTLKFSRTLKSLSDNLIWWEPSLNVGLPELLYANDSTIFVADFRLFASEPIRDAKAEYGLFAGDSLKYMTSFEDNAAFGRSVKLDKSVASPAGSFNNCLLFEKKAPFSRKDQVIFKPGLGVIRYTYERAPIGSMQLKLQKVSTLVSFHLE